MPTFTAIAIDSLLEPGPSKSNPPNPSSMLERRNGKSVAEMKVLRPQINPELYATPETAPLSLSPSVFSPSPYVINHKRRGPRLLNSLSEAKGSSDRATKEEGLEKIDELKIGDYENYQELKSGRFSDELVRESDTFDEIAASNADCDEESEVFFDPQESMSIASYTDDENAFAADSSQKFQMPRMEFVDSWEEQSSRHVQEEVERKLSEMRLNLFMEADRRKQAEEALSKMKSQWLNIKQQLSSEGLQLDEDEDLSQQIYLARFVSDAIGRGTMRAEIEMKMEVELEFKNFEINRLLDRIRYYETVNHELSQRNQEAVEMGRREMMRRRRRRQKWLWSSVVAAITIGTAALAWSYLPSEIGSSSSPHPDKNQPSNPFAFISESSMTIDKQVED